MIPMKRAGALLFIFTACASPSPAPTVPEAPTPIITTASSTPRPATAAAIPSVPAAKPSDAIDAPTPPSTTTPLRSVYTINGTNLSDVSPETTLAALAKLCPPGSRARADASRRVGRWENIALRCEKPSGVVVSVEIARPLPGGVAVAGPEDEDWSPMQRGMSSMTITHVDVLLDHPAEIAVIVIAHSDDASRQLVMALIKKP
jgi:hypothetical protein